MKSLIQKSPKSSKTFSQYSPELLNNLKGGEPFELNLNVKIKSERRDDWVKELKVAVTSGSSVSITVTDAEDPIFLYKAIITESDFHSLKQSQSLLIDFQQFPSKIIEMFETCKDSQGQLSNNNISILKGSSMFACILEEKSNGEGLLSIQEITQLCYLSHLKLTLKIPNDNLIKKHLSGLVHEYKQKYEALYEENKDQKERIENLSSKFAQISEDMKLQSNNREMEVKSKQNEFELSLMTLEKKHQQEIIQIKSSYEDRYNELDKNSQAMTKSLKHELSLMQEKYIKTNDDYMETSRQKREIEILKEKLQKENSSLKLEIDKLQSENKDLITQKYQNEKQIIEFTVKLQSITEQSSEKEKGKSALLSLVKSHEAVISELEGKNKSLKEKLDLSVAEINKANSHLEQHSVRFSNE